MKRRKPLGIKRSGRDRSKFPSVDRAIDPDGWVSSSRPATLPDRCASPTEEAENDPNYNIAHCEPACPVEDSPSAAEPSQSIIDTPDRSPVFGSNPPDLTYEALFEKYQDLLNLRETRAESILASYRENAEARFKASESLVAKLEQEIASLGSSASLSASPGDLDSTAVIELYSQLTGIVLRQDLDADNKNVWVVSVSLPVITDSLGEFQFLLYPSPDLGFEYHPLTLSPSNQHRDQALRCLPPSPPSFLSEAISFKAAALPQLLFHLSKWLRSKRSK